MIQVEAPLYVDPEQRRRPEGSSRLGSTYWCRSTTATTCSPVVKSETQVQGASPSGFCRQDLPLDEGLLGLQDSENQTAPPRAHLPLRSLCPAQGWETVPQVSTTS